MRVIYQLYMTDHVRTSTQLKGGLSTRLRMEQCDLEQEIPTKLMFTSCLSVLHGWSSTFTSLCPTITPLLSILSRIMSMLYLPNIPTGISLKGLITLCCLVMIGYLPFSLKFIRRILCIDHICFDIVNLVIYDHINSQ